MTLAHRIAALDAAAEARWRKDPWSRGAGAAPRFRPCSEACREANAARCKRAWRAGTKALPIVREVCIGGQ